LKGSQRIEQNDTECLLAS